MTERLLLSLSGLSWEVSITYKVLKASFWPVNDHSVQCELVVVQSLNHIQLFATTWTAAHQASLSFIISWSLLKLMSIESVMPSNHFILSRPFSCLQSFPASGSFPMSEFFTSGGQSIEASASTSVLPRNIQGWFPLGWLVWSSVQWTLKSLLQHHNSKALILWCSAFFMV